jgi:SAM-dependent methyltransferase
MAHHTSAGLAHGVHYTEDTLAFAHARTALKIWELSGAVPQSVLDPACGEGSLLLAAKEAGYTGPLHGVDVDALPLAQAQALGVQVQHGDFLFDVPPPDSERYDLLLGNPPWIGKVSFHCGREYATRIAKRFKPYNASADLLHSGEWAMIHFEGDGHTVTGAGVRPVPAEWTGTDAAVWYTSVHLVRTAHEPFRKFAFEPFKGGHWVLP